MNKAVYVKTESGDNYLWCIPKEANVIEHLRENMAVGREYNYICQIMVTDTQGKDEYIDSSEIADDDY